MAVNLTPRLIIQNSCVVEWSSLPANCGGGGIETLADRRRVHVRRQVAARAVLGIKASALGDAPLTHEIGRRLDAACVGYDGAVAQLRGDPVHRLGVPDVRTDVVDAGADEDAGDHGRRQPAAAMTPRPTSMSRRGEWPPRSECRWPAINPRRDRILARRH